MPSGPLRALAVFTFAAMAGCATSSAGSAPASSTAEGAASSDQPIAVIHAHKCNRCHSLPQPGTRTREHLTDAFSRHRNRVHLTPEQWDQMIDYLAAPAAATDLQTH